jgi:hypothetical protein
VFAACVWATRSCELTSVEVDAVDWRVIARRLETGFLQILHRAVGDHRLGSVGRVALRPRDIADADHTYLGLESATSVLPSLRACGPSLASVGLSRFTFTDRSWRVVVRGPVEDDVLAALPSDRMLWVSGNSGARGQHSSTIWVRAEDASSAEESVRTAIPTAVAVLLLEPPPRALEQDAMSRPSGPLFARPRRVDRVKDRVRRRKAGLGLRRVAACGTSPRREGLV